MQLGIYQIIVVLISIIFILKALSHFFRKEKTLRELVAWFIFWGGLAYLALFPDNIKYLAYALGMKSGLNAIIFLSLALLFFICFKLIILLEENEKKLTRLVRKLALRDLEEKKNEKR